VQTGSPNPLCSDSCGDEVAGGDAVPQPWRSAPRLVVVGACCWCLLSLLPHAGILVTMCAVLCCAALCCAVLCPGAEPSPLPGSSAACWQLSAHSVEEATVFVRMGLPGACRHIPSGPLTAATLSPACQIAHLFSGEWSVVMEQLRML
jgi:hypothetical protein